MKKRIKKTVRVVALVMAVIFVISAVPAGAEVRDNTNPILSPLETLATAASSAASSLQTIASKQTSSSSSGGDTISKILYFTGGGVSYASYTYSGAVATYSLSSYGITDYTKCDVELVGSYETCIEAGNNSTSKYYTTYAVNSTAYISGGKLYVYGPCAAKLTIYK